MNDGAFEIQRRLDAPVAEVFRWWTDPGLLSEWMTPIGTAEVQVDLRIGGALRVVMRGEGVVIHHTGEYLEIDVPRRLTFTWHSPYTGEEGSLVTVEFEPDGDNATRLTLTHSKLPEHVAGSHEAGWGTMIDRLSDRIRANAGVSRGR